MAVEKVLSKFTDALGKGIQPGQDREARIRPR
jgi:hypothetical protein